MKIGLVCATALTLTVLYTPLAQAQGAPSRAGPAATVRTGDYTEEHVDGNQVVTFGGDPLPGDTNDPYFGVIRPISHVLRAQLLRPRLNFVPELLKSVENL
jgi:hypothetical protein